ncbi:hypothetical protein BAJUN_01730 [Bajunvirus bajun]|uniref:Uncharacterized protein n=1 Tax=Brevundimonas phage vB_BgoS-Bajun TaxID=2948594 RepID=A0A9E7N6T4_9CAUD|nr:hypothetical protein BAJUN_01730 [Brevundimonas phage vB_BgoS-Bajun]
MPTAKQTAQAIALTPSTGEAVAMILHALDIGRLYFQREVEATDSLSNKELAQVRLDTFERASIIARESGVLITAEGESVAAILDDLFNAMPTPGTDKLSKPWNRALKQARRPRYRFKAGTGSATVTDTLKGVSATTRHPGPVAAAREAFANTDSGAHVTPAGVGVCGLDEDKARSFLATAERGR